MVKKDLDTMVTVDKIVDTLMVDELKYQEEQNNMVYKVPPYNDELDTNEAADYYETTNDKRVHPDSPYDAITEARLVEWLSFKGNTESTFNPALEFDLIAVLKGWPEDVTPLDFTYTV